MLAQVATVVAQRATCGRRQVGAVIAREGRILSTGYNGPAQHRPHCSDELCDLSVSCTRSIHAEANAIAFAAREGISLLGSDPFVTLSPCVPCAQLIAKTGIQRVFYLDLYREPDGILWLEKHTNVLATHWKEP